MQELSTAGEQALQAVARRHGFGLDATRAMLDAVARGNGSMAQFSHPEFGGSGQWMRGGMTMVSDMFNHSLKGAVNALCDDLAELVSNSTVPPGFDRQTGTPARSAANWWPGDLGSPNASGSQNGTRYAYFARPRRLAIEVDGRVTVYDTQEHQIGGVSQQQSLGRSLTFTSRQGTVDLASLPVVSGEANPPPREQPQLAAGQAPAASQPGQDVFASIERLAELRSRNIVSEEEFVSKKKELLSRV